MEQTAAPPAAKPAAKAPLHITARAAARLRDYAARGQGLVRVAVNNKGCSGHSYEMQFVAAAGPGDLVVEQDGATLIVDNKSLLYLIGTEMDWLEDKFNARFDFRNPNAADHCGCGESFAVKGT